MTPVIKTEWNEEQRKKAAMHLSIVFTGLIVVIIVPVGVITVVAQGCG